MPRQYCPQGVIFVSGRQIGDCRHDLAVEYLKLRCLLEELGSSVDVCLERPVFLEKNHVRSGEDN